MVLKAVGVQVTSTPFLRIFDQLVDEANAHTLRSSKVSEAFRVAFLDSSNRLRVVHLASVSAVTVNQPHIRATRHPHHFQPTDVQSGHLWRG